MSLLTELLIAAGVCVGAFTAGYLAGHKNGENGQKVSDQALFEKINKDLTDQKAEANNALEAAYAKNAADAASQAARTHDLEERHVQDSAATAAANARAPRILRITVPSPGCGASSPGPSASQAAASGANATTTVELPAEVSRRILAVGFDANTLADNYRACFAFVNGP